MADEAHISVRFKHGIHTIYLFVDALAPFADVSSELVDLVRERYPSGLTTSVDPPKKTVVDADAKLAYGTLRIPTDPSKGWKKLNVGEGDIFTPTKCGLKQNSIVAFTVISAEDQDIEFEVEWPKEDDELYEQGA
ncbi:hypothetical protein HIM_05168 [Hirsutella minnesotensis 3608]|uniref:Ubiquitin-like domain-containing protein n=1 Tax=Hirsutella minnesotensis 3608 TaxID=1043627 RepID=A0A0F8A0M0_9HYPO|nr:hypothetical protein HIM_05168 [Hirsutella minnesotensis 3608]